MPSLDESGQSAARLRVIIDSKMIVQDTSRSIDEWGRLLPFGTMLCLRALSYVI